MCLTTNRNNHICVYHHNIKAKKQLDEDDATSKRFKVVGTPYPRTIARTKSRHSRASRITGRFNCGCPEEAVLWDFYLWKTMTVKNEDGIEEGLTSSQRIDPRMQLFFIERYSVDTTLTIDDLYMHGKSAEEVEKRLIRTQVKRLKRRLDVLTRKSKQGKSYCSLIN
jgi:hypothetical protein